MAEVSIAGTDLPRVDSVQFGITTGGGDANQLPYATCTITIPADSKVDLTKWALAPQGEDRFKKVKIETKNRANGTNKTWTFAKAFLASLSETETGDGQPTTTSFTIVGTLIHATDDYDGSNILKVEEGEEETVPD